MLNRLLRPVATNLAASSSSGTFFAPPLLARAFRAATPLLNWHSRNPQFAKPQKWRFEPEPSQTPGAPHSGFRAEKRKLGEKSYQRKLDDERAARGLRPRRLIKTRKRIAHARHTHIARFRLRKGPAPRVKPEWDDPEQATRDAMIQLIDPYELDPDLPQPGRRWHAAEVRLKSNEDLQKLWIVLLKERNMLHTARMHHKKRKTTMPHPQRIKTVRKSMAMIRVVLGERQKEKFVRDQRLHAEDVQERAMDSLDLAASDLWPPWMPGGARLMPLNQPLTFNIVMRTHDGAAPLARPPADNLQVHLLVDGEEVPQDKIDAHFVLRPPAHSRPHELNYACHVKLRGDVLPRARFLKSATKLADEPLVDAELRATFYGEEVGEGAVPVHLMPSKRLLRRVKMAEINAQMQEQLRQAREEAAREAGVELPPPSPTPPPTDYWSGTLNRPLL